MRGKPCSSISWFQEIAIGGEWSGKVFRWFLEFKKLTKCQRDTGFPSHPWRELLPRVEFVLEKWQFFDERYPMFDQKCPLSLRWEQRLIFLTLLYWQWKWLHVAYSGERKPKKNWLVFYSALKREKFVGFPCFDHFSQNLVTLTFLKGFSPEWTGWPSL